MSDGTMQIDVQLKRKDNYDGLHATMKFHEFTTGLPEPVGEEHAFFVPKESVGGEALERLVMQRIFERLAYMASQGEIVWRPDIYIYGP